jgi:hypothetical protein
MVLNMIIEIEEVGWIRNGSGLFDTHCTQANHLFPSPCLRRLIHPTLKKQSRHPITVPSFMWLILGTIRHGATKQVFSSQHAPHHNGVAWHHNASCTTTHQVNETTSENLYFCSFQIRRSLLVI